MDFNNLKIYRKRFGLTQEQVAEQLGVSRQAVLSGNAEFNIFKETKLNPHYNSIVPPKIKVTAAKLLRSLC